MAQDMNSVAADAVSAASFLLTALALLITAVAIAIGAWANWQAKKMEWRAKRLDMSYRLLISAAGGADARLPNGDRHYSSIEVQTVAIATLRQFPEYLDTFERLLIARRRLAELDPGNGNTTLLAEVEALVTAVRG